MKVILQVEMYVILPNRFQAILLQGVLYGPSQGISQKD
jgi:hypothetical protein